MPLVTPEQLTKYNALIAQLAVSSPVDILTLFHPEINSGKITLHPWQVEELLRFAVKPGDIPNVDKPVRSAIVAPNGSGKSQFIVAAVAAFYVFALQESEFVITNASGAQLDRQAGRFLKLLCSRINNFFKEQLGFTGDVFDIQVRKIENNYNGSYVDLFATDEPGKAEGWHPIKPGGYFGICVDEAKSVLEEIYEALDRCNGYTHLLYISSPGGSRTGTFYKACSEPALGFHTYHVQAGESSHISKSSIALIIKKYGLHHPFVRSSIFAEFTSTDDQVVIPRDLLVEGQKLYLDRPGRIFGKKRAGLDLSAGGDEQVLSIWHGCKMLEECAWNITYAPVLRDEVISKLREHGIEAGSVWMDDGGMGRTFGDMFQEAGWTFNRVLNQARAFDTTRYVNRGAELWFNFKRYIEENLILLLPQGADKLIDQLSSRYYRIRQQSNKIQLESKEEAKLKGHASPDRADAAILAWAGYTYPLAELDDSIEDGDKKNTLEGDVIFKGKRADANINAWYQKVAMERAGLKNAKNGEHGDGSEDNLDKLGNYRVADRFTISLREICKLSKPTGLGRYNL